jgi:ubiquitin C-terminal hydrolase
LGIEREASFGHYIAFINFRGQWIMYNDEQVVGIDNDNAQAFLRFQAQAYMAFYISDFYREEHPRSF